MMVIHQAFKFRLYPNADQRQALAHQFGCSRFVYNYFLRERMDFYAAHKGETKQGLNYNDTAAMLTALKRQPEYPWLKDVNAQALQQSLKDLDTAYTNFFAGRAAFPKFKKRRDKQTFRVPQSFRLDTRLGQMTLPKVEPIKIVVHRPVIGTLKSVTVSRAPSGRYFASILCEIDVADPTPKRQGKERGVDLGLKSFAVTSDGEKVEAPQYLRWAEEKLSHLQRELSRKQPGSKNREKARVKAARQHEKIANQRQNFHHQLSHRLIDESQAIFVESLNVKGMLANHSLAKSIGDVGWGEFLRQLEYKAERGGCHFEAIDRFFPSTKRCRRCGYIKADLTLADREWDCPECHTHHDRDYVEYVLPTVGQSPHNLSYVGIFRCAHIPRNIDVNAALNILLEGRALTELETEPRRAGMARTQTPGETCARRAGRRTRKPPASGW